jgi:hypothetical protein
LDSPSAFCENYIARQLQNTLDPNVQGNCISENGEKVGKVPETA